MVGLLGLGWILAASATAAELGESVYLGGFVSQGYINTADYDYLMSDTRDGSGEFNEAAVIVSAQPLDDLRVGIQLLGRDFGSHTGPQVMVDWAYGDFRWRDELGLRAGRIKLPYGLYNQGRDVDMLRTSVLLPQSVYSERDRDLLIAYEGVGLYGNLPVGGWGEFDYELVYGGLSVPEGGLQATNYEFLHDARLIEPEVAEHLADMLGVAADSVTASLGDVDGVEVAVPWIGGGSLVWTTPLTGLRVGSSYYTGDVESRSSVKYDIYVRDGGVVPRYLPWTLDGDQEIELHQVITGSLEYQHEGLVLAAEFAETRIGDQADLGWYGSAQYRVSDRWSFETVYSVYFPDKDDKDGTGRQELDLPDHNGWQRDLGLSARFDVNRHWLIKVEFHAMDGTAMVLPSDLEDLTAADRYWRMLAAKTTFHF